MCPSPGVVVADDGLALLSRRREQNSRAMHGPNKPPRIVSDVRGIKCTVSDCPCAGARSPCARHRALSSETTDWRCSVGDVSRTAGPWHGPNKPPRIVSDVRGAKRTVSDCLRAGARSGFRIYCWGATTRGAPAHGRGLLHDFPAQYAGKSCDYCAITTRNPTLASL